MSATNTPQLIPGGRDHSASENASANQGATPLYPNSHQLRDLVRMRRRGIFIYALPNIFTSANLVFGFLSIVFAIDARYDHAAWALILASVFDLLDGRL